MITQISREMKRVMTEAADEAGQKAGLIQRQRKVTSRNLGQTLVMGWWQDPEITLEGLSQMGRSVGLDISAQGIDQRLNQTTAVYLKELLEAVVQVKMKPRIEESVSGTPFSHIYVEDSSMVTFMEPISEQWQGLGGKGPTSAVKMQVRLDLQGGKLDGPHLRNGRTHDREAAQAHEEIEKQALHLRDLGYWNLKDWVEANDKGYYLLSAIKTPTHFWIEGESYTCHSWCAKQRETSFDVPILLGKTDRLPARLIGRKASEKVAAQRVRKLKRASKVRGQTVSKERLALCAWTLIVTNAPPELISTRDAFIWFGVRWQIELVFKLWKSVGKIDKSRSSKPWRHLCEFYAKLIGMTLQHWLFIPAIWAFADRSLTKASMTIRLHVIRIATSLHSVAALSRVIEHICHILAAGCRINSSIKQPRTFQKLQTLQSVRLN